MRWFPFLILAGAISMAAEDRPLLQEQPIRLRPSPAPTEFSHPNLLVNGNFTEGLGHATGRITSSEANTGWLVNPVDLTWAHDSENELVRMKPWNADEKKGVSLGQVIRDNHRLQGKAMLHVTTSDTDTGNPLRLRVFGVEGPFEINLYRTTSHPFAQENAQGFHWKTLVYGKLAPSPEKSHYAVPLEVGQGY